MTDDLFRKHGDPVVGEPCPRCHKETVVYNGNYWCISCTWVMPEKGIANNRIIKAYLSQRHHEAASAGNTEEMAQMAFYLKEYQ